ncbi:MAG: caspase family protein [Candidatus Krumholzibacteriota bacterium]|nr:caspase family protein [Candidatus Krumholzibacteriota bacterium]
MRRISIFMSIIMIISVFTCSKAQAEWIKGPCRDVLRVGESIEMQLPGTYELSAAVFYAGANDKETIDGVLEYSIDGIKWDRWTLVTNLKYNQSPKKVKVTARYVKFIMLGGGGRDGLISFCSKGSEGFSVYGAPANYSTSKSSNVSGVSVTGIKGYGIDYSDKSKVCFIKDYPHLRMDDVPTRCKYANAKWDGSYEIKGKQLILKMNNIGTESKPGHMLGLGYTVTIKGATFDDGTTTKSFVLYKFSGNPTQKSAQKIINIIPTGKPELVVSAALKSGYTVLTDQDSVIISVKVDNIGDGDANNVQLMLRPTRSGLISLSPEYKIIDSLPAGKNRYYFFTIKGTDNIESGTARLTVDASTRESQSKSIVLEIPTKRQFSSPTYPADLVIENIVFKEPSGNNALDGYETGKISFFLSNKGKGEAQNIRISLSPLGSAEGLIFSAMQIVERLNPNSRKELHYPIKAEYNITSLDRQFRIQAVEEFGFDADPVNIRFETKRYEPPDLRIEKIAIDDSEDGDAYGNKNSIIEPNESIVVTAFIQNFGTGTAENVTAKIIVDHSVPNLFVPMEKDISNIGNIPPGEYREYSFFFHTTKRFSRSNIPIKVELSESKGHYGKIIDLALKMNERSSNIIDIDIAKIPTPQLNIKPLPAITSDIDRIKRKSKNSEPDDFAVIIGIEKYKYAPDVTYAARDAGAFYNYALDILGIPDRNIIYRVNEDATAAEFMKIFDKDGWIARRITEDSDVYIFYSGHGAPNLKRKEPYIIPSDVDPNYMTSGLSLPDIYSTMDDLKLSSVTILLDACFSGQSREKELLLAGSRPAVIELHKRNDSYNNVTVMAAASGMEISSYYPEQSHGIFTYFLLKGLQGLADSNGDNSITVGELFNYIKPNVSQTAAFLDREQTPDLLTKDKSRVLVEY